jgi:uncharacterized damage-inducible protein DinB
MRLVERLIDQLNRAWGGDAWHGPPLRTLLDGIGERESSERPLAGTHTIGEIVTHVAVWIDVVTRRLQGEAYEPASAAEDWPPSDQFTLAIARLEAAHSRLLDTVARMSPEALDEPVPGKPYTAYVMLEGIIQHNLYHAGQIAILKRSLASSAPATPQASPP